jgi:single-strand DNA-binding protein
MKSITIAGNIGKDAEIRTTQGGETVTSFNVAVEERNGQDKRSLWFTCSLWGKRGTALAQYLTKGGKVSVSGDFTTREHEGKTYLQIRADQVTLMGGGQRDESPRTGGAPAGGNPMDDEIPFNMEWR